MGDSVEDDIDGERLLHPSHHSNATGATTAADETMPSKDANSTADIEDQFNANDIVDEMTIEDLRHLAKCIIRVAEDNKDDRILSEVNFLIRRQQHQRRKHNAKDGGGNPISSSTAQDPSHPDSILSLPPLLKNARSHDSDREINAPKLFSRRQKAMPKEPVSQTGNTVTSREPMSPTERTSNTQRRKVVIPTAAIQNEPLNIDGSGGKKEIISDIVDFGKQQLLVLCNPEPATEKECKDQDLAMELCKNMGIVPSLIVSALTSESSTTTKEEQLLVDSMALKAGGETVPAYSYPQFFVRNILQGQNIDEGNVAINYKGNYDTMEELYRTGRFGVISVASAGGAADTTTPRKNDNRDILGSFNSETSKPAVPKGGITRTSASVGEPSLPSPRHKSSQNPPSEPPLPSPQPIPDQQSSSPPRSRSQSPEPKGSINNSSSSSNSSSGLHLLDLSKSDLLQCEAQNGDTSYAHLDGMNQPKSTESSVGSGSCSEMSLGDDLRMIFDIEDIVGTISTVEEVNEMSVHTPTRLADIPTITEDVGEEDEEESNISPAQMSEIIAAVSTITEDEEDEEESNVFPAQTPASLAAVPTITEEEEEEEDEVEEHSTVSPAQTSSSLVAAPTITEDEEDEDEEESNVSPAHTPTSLGAIPTITEKEEEDEDEEESKVSPTQTPANIASVPTITEDEEDEDEDEEQSNVSPSRSPASLAADPIVKEDKEDEDGEESTEDAENLKTSSLSMTVLSSGAIVKRETVTLKPQKLGPEPSGTMSGTDDASIYLDQAKGLLKSPPSSPKKPYKPVEPKRKKIPNPYYALDYYSGGGNGGDNFLESETNLSREQSLPPTISDPVATVIDPPVDEGEATEMPVKDDEDEILERDYLPWEKKFIGIGACYLVFHDSDDELNIHYSESPMANAVGVWTSQDIANFKATQGLSECELIGTCASQVTKDKKYYCQGWCQFVKAAKIMDATVTALVDVGLPMEIYLYEKGRTIQVSPCDGEAVFDTKAADAIACVPKGCGFPASGIVGKKWGKLAKKLGAVALFRSLSTKKSKEIGNENLAKHGTNNSSVAREIPVPISAPHDESSTPNTLDVISAVPSAPKSLSSVIDHLPKTALISDSPTEPEAPTEPQATTPLSSKSTLNTLYDISPVPSAPKSLSSIIDDFPKTALILDSPTEPEAPTEPKASTSLSSKLLCPDGGACYLAYDPDSSGQLVEHYSKIPVDFAIGRWIPGSEKVIAGFKFKRNVGRNVLIGNCSGGVQGRKNFYSGWCQFVRSAKNMKGKVILWDPAVGHKGLKVDVYLYYDDYRPSHQTVRMEEGITYTTNRVVAVACLPKETPFFENMAADLLLWLAEGSKHGYSTKMM